ncbi:rRNA maturation RNase YbeY [Candidatus Peregrinibacteria bacterium]|nr:rRNA maturation RNase YbeY [Candidatus Peregrinibacteria bacterium]
MIKFGFVNETKAKVAKKSFEALAKKFYRVLKPHVDKLLFKRDGLMDLVIVDDKKIQAMNKEYRDKNVPTDVISFAYLEVTQYEKDEGDIIAGDIFISIDTAKKQAKVKGHSLMKEMEILFVHGMLHCFGFDHKNDKQEKEMEKWAGRIMG